MQLDSDRIDIGGLFGPKATVGTMLGWLAGGEKAASAGAEETSWYENTVADVDLRIGTAVLPNAGDVAVVARLLFDNGDLKVNRLNLSTKSGLIVRADGALQGLGNRPDGKLTLSIDGSTSESVRSLAALLDIPESRLGTQQQEAMSPMRVVGGDRIRSQQGRSARISYRRNAREQ